MNQPVNNQFPNFAAVTQAAAAAADTPLAAVLQATQTHQAAALEPADEAEDEQALADVPVNKQVDDYISRFVYAEESSIHLGGVVGVINFFGTGCLDCKHLVEGAEMDYRNCHFSKGNQNCPARSLRVQFIGERVKWESKVNKVKALPNESLERRVALRNLYDQACNIEDEGLQAHVLSLLGF